MEIVKECSLHFCELLREQLYFATLSEDKLKPLLKRTHSKVHYLFVDNDFIYQSFNQDFGPLNLGMLYLYCKKVDTLFKKKGTIVHLTSIDKEKRANAAFLVGAYCILSQHILPHEVIKKLKEESTSYLSYKNFAHFVHAGFDSCRYPLHLEDCFDALYKAIKLKFFDYDTFNIKEYQHYEKVENGDLNWIVPRRFIAFCDPLTYSGSCHSSNIIDFYVNYFVQHNVTTVIRLNKRTYDAKRFVEKGIVHRDLIFSDGSAPSDGIMQEFLSICKSSPGAIAVHCKAGLGRTGTLIACYLMKHYHFSAPEATAWIRICRPGSIIGYQQKWLERKQSFLWQEGEREAHDKPKNMQSTTNAMHHSNFHHVYGDDCANNNNFEIINVVKCRISPTTGCTKDDHANKDHDNNQNGNAATKTQGSSELNDSSLNKLIRELDNVNFDECLENGFRSCRVNNIRSNNNKKSQQQQKFTQGDYLNQIKRNRKKPNMFISNSSNDNKYTKHGPNSISTLPTRTTCSAIASRQSSPFESNTSTPVSNLVRVVKLDPNNNFSISEHSTTTKSNDGSHTNSTLKLYGKKIDKIPSTISKILPR